MKVKLSKGEAGSSPHWSWSLTRNGAFLTHDYGVARSEVINQSRKTVNEGKRLFAGFPNNHWSPLQSMINMALDITSHVDLPTGLTALDAGC